MTKEECEQLIEVLNLDFATIEFPINSGMYVFVQVLNKITGELNEM